jgi:DNA-binding SARP family transcriptional activator
MVSQDKQEHSRESLATLFWPEYDQDRALKNLRRILWSLNQSLPEGLLVIKRDSLGLVDDHSVWIDVNQFMNLTSIGDTLPHPALANGLILIPGLEKAASLYRGDFLAGFNLPDCPEFDDWQFFRRERLRNKAAQIFERLGQAYSEQQNWERAIEYARRWVSLDRLHEPAQRGLIRLYAQANQRSAALRQYDEYARSGRR